jgi:hypothetical protein
MRNKERQKQKRAIIVATGLSPFSQGSESRETGGHNSPGKVESYCNLFTQSAECINEDKDDSIMNQSKKHTVKKMDQMVDHW